MSEKALIFTWTGDVMRPIGRLASLAASYFVEGENYRLTPVEDRSDETHRHYFACITAAFNNLPEQHQSRWKDTEALRKWALCEAGYHDEITYQPESAVEAFKIVATFGIAFDQIVIRDRALICRRARSQSKKAMPAKGQFQASKDAVFNVLSKLIGVSVDELKRQGAEHERASADRPRSGRTRARADVDA